MVNTLSLDRLMLRRRGGAEDLRARVAGDLGCRDPDPTCRGMDQHPVPFPQPAHDHQGGVRRGVVHAKCRAFFKAEVLRHRHHISRLGNRELRLTAELGPGHHALPDGQPGNALPDRLDLTGNLIAQDARRLRRGGVQTRPAPSCPRS